MNKTSAFFIKLAKALILPAAMFALIFILTRFIGRGQFMTTGNLLNIVKNTLLSSCISLAMACNMLNHRWDFSVGMMVILVPVLATPIAQKLNLGIALFIPLCLVIGLLLGLLNGVTYMLFRVPAIVTSLGFYVIYESVITVYNGGIGAKVYNTEILKLAKFPGILILALAGIMIFYILFTHTKFGYNCRALANSQRLAVSNGINEKRNVIGCYLMMGFLVAVAGMIYLSMTGTIVADMRENGSSTIMFEAFPPVFIGFYLMRYTNLATGVFLGTLSMKILISGMLALGVPATLQNVGTGLFLLIFISFTSNQARMMAARRAKRRVAALHTDKKAA